MSISELVQKVGAENIQVQFLSECLKSASYSEKTRVTTITFGNQGVSVGAINSGKMVGIVLWIPKEKLP